MDTALQAQLKERCGSFLHTNGVKIKAAKGRTMVHAFWYGALVALNQPDNPWVSICLLAGRFDDLVTMPKENSNA